MMYEQFQRMRRIAALPPFKDMIATELNPGPGVQSEAEIKEWIRKSFMTIYRASPRLSSLSSSLLPASPR